MVTSQLENKRRSGAVLSTLAETSRHDNAAAAHRSRRLSASRKPKAEQTSTQRKSRSASRTSNSLLVEYTKMEQRRSRPRPSIFRRPTHLYKPARPWACRLSVLACLFLIWQQTGLQKLSLQSLPVFVSSLQALQFNYRDRIEHVHKLPLSQRQLCRTRSYSACLFAYSMPDGNVLSCFISVRSLLDCADADLIKPISPVRVFLIGQKKPSLKNIISSEQAHALITASHK
ncbi:conserved hypothetical protein [Trichinella spiralis]|uniref:hypothetical protein n=1 Tax=Trichinella spiralis TaxID=6334 RepID=UPI0001EFE532|nr:conserved hypothetical protein [Trichinella spiralis]